MLLTFVEQVYKEQRLLFQVIQQQTAPTRKSLNQIVFEVDKILKRYQIKIIRYLDGNYIKNFFQNDNTELSTMVHKIHNGINNNEVKLVNKNLKKLGFFEKFFQFFS